MTLVDIAECLSAFAAFITVCLAIAELASRSKIKKADTAMEIYADYLHIRQQLDYVIKNLDALAKNCDSMDQAEIISYAKSHFVEQSIFERVNKIEKNSICNFNYSATKNQFGKDNSKQILSFSGEVTNLLVLVNTLYESIQNSGDISASRIRSKKQMIDALYEASASCMLSTGDLLRKNLIKTHTNSNIYLIVLIASALFFFAIGFIL